MRPSFFSLVSVLLTVDVVTTSSVASFFKSPTLYHEGDKVDMLINKVQSDNTQLPYPYYELPFTCPPNEKTTPIPLSLGQIFRGDRIVHSDYQLNFKQDQDCVESCTTFLTPQSIRKAKDLIAQNYSNDWIIDDLPSATTLINTEDESKFYQMGFSLGSLKSGKYYLNNHAMIVIRYHQERDAQEYTIVGFEVYPKSVVDENCPGAKPYYEHFELDEEKATGHEEGLRIPFTYSVYWREEPRVNYNERWDLFVNKEEKHIAHWASLCVSIGFSTFGFMFIKYLSSKLLMADIREKDKSSNHEWKHLKNEVFFSPKYCLFLSVLIGAGIQLLITVTSMVALFAFKILNNDVPGRSLSYAIFSFVVSGTTAGYSTYFFYDKFVYYEKKVGRARSNSSMPRKKFKLISSNSRNTNSKRAEDLDDIEHDWFHVSFYSGAALPGLIIFIVLFLNFFIWAKESSTALPFGTILLIIIFYFFFEIPLALFGGYVAYTGCIKRHSKDSFLPAPITSPVLSSPIMENFNRELNTIGEETHKIKQINTKKSSPFYFHPVISQIIFGFSPFCAILTQLSYIYKIFWIQKNTFYHLHGELLLTIIMVIILVMESVVANLILRLNSGDPKWQWQSFMTGSSPSTYVFLYSIYYYIKKLSTHYDFVSGLLYFAYTFLITLLLALSLGSVGLVTGYFYIRKKYGNKKID